MKTKSDSDSNKEISPPSRFKNILIFFSLSSTIIFCGTNHTAPTFFNYTPPFTCKGYENLDPCDLNKTLIVSENNTKGSSYFNSTKYCVPSDFEYHGINNEISIVTEWNLVCDRTIHSHLSVICYFISVAIGSLISGWMIDSYGRKFTTYSCVYIQSFIVVLTSCFANSILTFTILRFLQGLFLQGITVGSSLLINEIMPNIDRALLNEIITIFWSMGLILLAVGALIFHNWRIWSIIVCMVPLFISTCSLWFVPESKMWIKSRKSQKAAITLTTNRIKIYKSPVDDERSNSINSSIVVNDTGKNETRINNKRESFEGRELLNDLSNNCDEVKVDDTETESTESKNKDSTTSQIKLVLANRVLFGRSLLMMLLWFDQTISYYGMTYSIPALSGNHYLNFIYGAVGEIVFVVIAGFITQKFGRRLASILSYIGTGVCMLLTVIFPATNLIYAEWLKTLCAIFGKGCVTGIYLILMLYSLELFPTQVRGLMLGSFQCCALIGSIITPFIVMNGSTSLTISIVSMSALNFICSIFSYTILPETKDKPLPETIEDALQLKKA